MVASLACSCGNSYEESQERQRQARLAEARADSAALKVAVMPTIDCLPAYVARELHLIDTTAVDVRLKVFDAQIDCDTALARGHVEGAFTDIVRGQMLARRGTPVDYAASTAARWQLTTNRNARISQLNQLDDKMLAMTRHSATDMLADRAIANGGLQQERVYRVQVNDVGVRLQMIMVNTIDAALLPEPQATVARLAGHRQLMDSRSAGMTLGALAFRSDAMANKERKRQIDSFMQAYRQACDSIDKRGLTAFRHIIARYCSVSEAAVDSLPSDIKFAIYAPPSATDLQKADQWLDEAERWME